MFVLALLFINYYWSGKNISCFKGSKYIFSRIYILKTDTLSLTSLTLCSPFFETINPWFSPAVPKTTDECVGSWQLPTSPHSGHGATELSFPWIDPPLGGLCVLADHSRLHLALLLCSLLGALSALQLFQELAAPAGRWWKQKMMWWLHICTAPKRREQMPLASNWRFQAQDKGNVPWRGKFPF